MYVLHMNTDVLKRKVIKNVIYIYIEYLFFSFQLRKARYNKVNNSHEKEAQKSES